MPTTAGSGPVRATAADPRSASSSRSALSWAPTLADPESGPPETERSRRIEIEVGSDDELRALRGALLAARASELSEIQRRSQRHGLGYGTDSARESMTDEVASLRRRWMMLDRLLAAIDAATAPAADAATDPAADAATTAEVESTPSG